MLETVNDFGRKVTALFVPSTYCKFAPPEETLGVIDTSGARDGSRGIAFLCDEIRTNFGGQIMRVGYKQICSVRIIRSFETTFDDELEIEAPNCCIRITDCSLNKFFLKQLINSLSRLYYTMREDARAQLRAECTAAAMEHFSGSIPAVAVSVPAIDRHLPKPQPAAEPMKIPEGKINWLSSEPEKTEEAAPVTEVTEQKVVDEIEPTIAEDDILAADDELPEDMSREEALSYLMDSINEINSDETDSEDVETEAAEQPQLPQPEEAAVQPEEAVEQKPEEEKLPDLGLTQEPESDDIYIKASRRLRIFCEERRLTMEQMENAVKENMVSVAEMYSALSAQDNIPPNIAERAEKLRLATDRLTESFALGGGVAARVVFFMLYQMLSYSDRIAENEDTKERLNDFFRRYGGAGMALSLLDSGI